MDFKYHFDELNKVHKEIKQTNNLCCDNYKNYLCNGDGIIQCKICNNSITNIIDSPEWRYYGSSDSKNADPTRCGMPVNVLLPKSSLGTSIATTPQKICFVVAVLLLYLAADWPVHDIAEEHLYFVHMIQHVVITLIVPPLFLLALPSWLARLIILEGGYG